MPVLLNIGAGFMQPLHPVEITNIVDFATMQVINLDIYNQIVPYTPDRSRLPFPDHDIRYSDVQRQIELGDASVDAVLAISPYGYSTFNPEVLRVLKPGGVVCVMGHHANPYVAKERICAESLRATFNTLFTLVVPSVDSPGMDVIKYLMARKSHVTSGARETKIDTYVLYRKA